MTPGWKAWCYTIMILFDLIVIVGTAYLIVNFDWSAWWMLVAVIICTGSNPRMFFKDENE